jgi:hypothetical protein
LLNNKTSGRQFLSHYPNPIRCPNLTLSLSRCPNLSLSRCRRQCRHQCLNRCLSPNLSLIQRLRHHQRLSLHLLGCLS